MKTREEFRSEYDLDTLCRFRPYDHQIDGIQALVNNPVFALFDEMGAGKTLQVIAAAQILFNLGVINRVLVITPASVRSVWFDPELGELSKHLWTTTPCRITEFHAKLREWQTDENLPENHLHWIVTNYDFLRNKARLSKLRAWCSRRTWLVCDESSALKSHRSIQTKAVFTIRKDCGRVTLLNGTPIENNPGDLYAQGRVMDPRILDCQSWTHFRVKYAIMGGWEQKQVIAWKNVDDIQRRYAPYVMRRLKVDCLDLPPKLEPKTYTVPMSAETWKLYKAIRDEFIAWVSQNTAAVASTAAIKTIRLSQITSGFLAGIERQTELAPEDAVQADLFQALDDDRPAWLKAYDKQPDVHPALFEELAGLEAGQIASVGTEKRDFATSWLLSTLASSPNAKILVWVRFRPELAGLADHLEEKLPCRVLTLHGGSKKAERQEVMRTFHPDTADDEPCVLVGTTGTGAKGINLAASNIVIYVSSDWKLGTWLQSQDRVHRPGQTKPVSYFDVVATGPAGQKTIDSLVLASRQDKLSLANMTTEAWVRALT